MRYAHPLSLLCIAVSGVAIFLGGCASVPQPAAVTRAEMIREDNVVAAELAPRFEMELKLRRDTEVSVYLRQLAERLVNTQADIAGAGVGVFVVQDRRTQWWNYGLPGNRIYLSAGFLKSAEFENELAAAIAMEVSHLLRRDAIQRIRQQTSPAPTLASAASVATGSTGMDVLPPSDRPTLPKAIDYFGPNGIFIFPEESRLEAVDTAVDILYKAGFDPRGLTELWRNYQDHGSRSPLEASTLAKLLDRTRSAIASYPPLRNPIVKSDRFIVIQKRIRRL